MDLVDFLIKTSTMKHPDYWTIIKLWNDYFQGFFTNITVVAAVLPIMAKRNAISKFKFMNI